MKDEFFIKIAALTVKISAAYPLSRELCRDFITEAVQNPDITASVSEEKINYELNNAKEKSTPEYAEFLCIYRIIAEQLPLFNCFVFHGAAISYKDRGYLFTAPSGTGKSTHIRLWRKFIGNDVDIINGDKPIIKVNDGKISVCSTPWAGKENWKKNRLLPLDAITVLTRSEAPFIEPLSPDMCLSRIMNQIYMPKTPEALAKTLELINSMLSGVPVYRLGCDISEESVRVAFEGITKEKYIK